MKHPLVQMILWILWGLTIAVRSILSTALSVVRIALQLSADVVSVSDREMAAFLK